MKFDNFQSFLFNRFLHLEDNKEVCKSCNDFRRTLNQRIRREALRVKQIKNNSKKVTKENDCYLSPTEIKLKLKRQRQQMFLQKQKICRQRLKLKVFLLCDMNIRPEIIVLFY